MGEVIDFANKYTLTELRVIEKFLNDRLEVLKNPETVDYFDYLRGEVRQARHLVEYRKMSISGGLARLDRM